MAIWSTLLVLAVCSEPSEGQVSVKSSTFRKLNALRQRAETSSPSERMKRVCDSSQIHENNIMNIFLLRSSSHRNVAGKIGLGQTRHVWPVQALLCRTSAHSGWCRTARLFFLKEVGENSTWYGMSPLTRYKARGGVCLTTGVPRRWEPSKTRDDETLSVKRNPDHENNWFFLKKLMYISKDYSYVHHPWLFISHL